MSERLRLEAPLQTEAISHREIRRQFLDYFRTQGHKPLPNRSLVPVNDPSLLFTNSGMAPLKKYFTGELIPPAPRLTNVQQCLRTNDIAEVGDASHLTFFEMLGNWSIGDYGKEKALTLAYELLTKVFKMNPNRIHVTYYAGDNKFPQISPDTEAQVIWRNLGLGEEHIHAMGAEDNYWGPAGTSGPSGPCSEVFYDMGPDKGCGESGCGPACPCGRFMEIWNPGVFMQYNMSETGQITNLPFMSVDAGAGLERFAMVLQGVDSVYDTDLLKPVKDAFVTENEVEENDLTRFAIRTITDHLRASVFLLHEGIKPGKKGKEYVLRRLIRRATTQARLLGITELKVDQALAAIEITLGEFYPGLTENMETIKESFTEESTKFSSLIQSKQKYIDAIIAAYREDGKIPQEAAVNLHATHGVPEEILLLYAEDLKLSVD